MRVSTSYLLAALTVSTVAAFSPAPLFTAQTNNVYNRLHEHSSSVIPLRSTEENTATVSTETPGAGTFDYALIFDCDGVIIETEELHRLAYNAAFDAAGLQINGESVEWTVEYYDILQNTVGGGKGKMFYHFRNTTGAFPTSDNGAKAAPTNAEEEQALVDALQAHKTELYKDLIEEKATPRPGVIELMDAAIADPKVAVGVCSASTKAAVTKVLDVTLGEERRNKLNVCILGDDVSKLKPDPLIYVTAAERLKIDPKRCVVVEDSMVGLKAAKGAGMKCLITYTKSTEREDFYSVGADAKVPELASAGVTFDKIFDPIRENGLESTILDGIKD
jgi:HAD superfamily hydrolase (TIGR01509 family)